MFKVNHVVAMAAVAEGISGVCWEAYNFRGKFETLSWDVRDIPVGDDVYPSVFSSDGMEWKPQGTRAQNIRLERMPAPREARESETVVTCEGIRILIGEVSRVHRPQSTYAGEASWFAAPVRGLAK